MTYRRLTKFGVLLNMESVIEDSMLGCSPSSSVLWNVKLPTVDIGVQDICLSDACGGGSCGGGWIL